MHDLKMYLLILPGTARPEVDSWWPNAEANLTETKFMYSLKQFKAVTLPDPNSSHLKIDGVKFPFWMASW